MIGNNMDANIAAIAANSRWRILTNNSISCITLRLDLNPGVASPFVHVRSRRFGQEVRIFLLKLFPIADQAGWLNIQGRLPYNGIEISTDQLVINEFFIQREVHNASLFSQYSFLDPICPDVIGCMQYTQTVADLTACLDRRANRTLDQEVEEIRTSIGDNGNGQVTGVRAILMEFMDGYNTYLQNITLNQALPNNRRLFLNSFNRFRLDLLHTLGFIHGDFHEGNSMVNLTDIRYNGGVNFQGELQIIDFGRTRIMTPQERLLTFQQQDVLEGGVVAPFVYGNATMQQFLGSEQHIYAGIVGWVTAQVANMNPPLTFAQWIAALRQHQRFGGSKKLKIIKKRKTTKKMKFKKIKGGYIEKMNEPNSFSEAEKMFSEKIVEGVFNKNGKISEEEIAKILNNKSFEEITDLLKNHFSKEKYLDAELEKLDEKDTSYSKTQKRSKQKMNEGITIK